MGLRLIIEDEEGATTIVPLGEEEVTIGREPGNTIQLTEQNVSRQHARLTQGPDGWVIEDLDSYNGVKVNGVLVEGSVTLNEGDVVQIGDYHLALSNNVEQTTLNLDRPSQAANDVTKALPSVDAVPRPGVFESGPSPTYTPSTDTHSAHDDEKEGGSKGLLMLLGLVMLLGVGFVGYKFIGGGDATTPVTKGNETKGDPPAKVEPKDPVKAVTPPDPTGAVVDPPPDASAGDPPDPPDPTGAVVDPPPETPKKTPPVTKTTPKKDTPKKDTPTEPRGDPKVLLDDARKASLANNATMAYELAKKSYDIDKNVAALQLMGVSACKMGDHNKAKSAYKKLEASRQKQLQAVCAEKGITLE